MKNRLHYGFSLFLGVMTMIPLYSKNIEIKDDFNSIQLERSTVAIEDHPELNPWEFSGPKKYIKCTDGVLTLGTVPGAGEVRIYSKEKWVFTGICG